MALRTIRYYGDPVLRKKAQIVKTIDPLLLRLLDDMAETMYAAKGYGLAAPQVGVSKRVIVVDVGEGLHKLINPKLQACSGNESGPEGCISLPNIFGEVERFQKVVVKALNPEGKSIRIEGEGLLARALQHEMDHLDGKLFVDTAREMREYIPENPEEAAAAGEEEPECRVVPITREELEGKFSPR